MLSGGQAAGGHNVIMGIFDMLKKINPESRIFGFLMGPHGVYSNNYIEICETYMGLYRNMGGFDMICKYLNNSGFQIFFPNSVSTKRLKTQFKFGRHIEYRHISSVILLFSSIFPNS